jgi:hypothetical protein
MPLELIKKTLKYKKQYVVQVPLKTNKGKKTIEEIISTKLQQFSSVCII